MPDGKSAVNWAITSLARLMVQSREPDSPGVVFLLGAGCSMQFGLPSFRDLLCSLLRHYENRRRLDPKYKDADPDRLRKELIDRYWVNTSPPARRKVLKAYLSGVQGDNCVGYLRLARLAAKGLVKGIVNMNFDTLLEEACANQGVEHHLASSFAQLSQAPKGGALWIAKPHGTIKDINDGKFVPILDLVQSNLFEAGEKVKAGEFFKTNIVAVVGYSLIDMKFVEALDPGEGQNDPPNLFLIGPSPVSGGYGAYLLGKRYSPNLYVTGEEGRFDRFMMALEEQVAQELKKQEMDGQQSTKRGKEGLASPPETAPALPATEESAARNCAEVALTLRYKMNVPEQPWERLTTHADDLFDVAVRLSQCMGLPLTSPETHLLRCAAYFHDLGLAWGMSEDNALTQRGLKLLRNHGEHTVALLRRHIESSGKPLAIFPATWERGLEDDYLDLICFLCKYHTRLDLDREAIKPLLKQPDVGPAEKPAEKPAKPLLTSIKVSGFDIAVRMDLLLAVFVAAEMLCQGRHSTDHNGIDDPIFDLFALDAVERFRPDIDPGSRMVSLEIRDPEAGGAGAGADKLLAWISDRAKTALCNLQSVTEGYLNDLNIRRDPIDRFVCTPTAPSVCLTNESQAIVGALEENMERLLGQIPEDHPARADFAGDLLAIYTLPPGGKGAGGEVDPRVHLTEASPVVQNALTLLKEGSREPYAGLLDLYFPIKLANPTDKLKQEFLTTFEKTWYPAWRFCARHVQKGTELLHLLGGILECGSTGLRREILIGLEHLPHHLYQDPDHKEWWYGHNKCIICTGRILHILALARPRILPGPTCQRITDQIDRYARGILHFLLSKTLQRDDWFGIPDEASRGNRVQSVRYLSWCLRGICQVLLAGKESQWLPELQADLKGLADQLWQHAADLDWPRLQTFRSEGSVALGLGNLAMAVREFQLAGFQVPFPRILQDAVDILLPMKGIVGEDDKFMLLPALCLVEQQSPPEKQQEHARTLYQLYKECANTCIWIRREGSRGYGSWGDNVWQTRIFSAVINAFWRHVFENEKRFAPFFDQEGAAEQEYASATASGAPGGTH